MTIYTSPMQTVRLLWSRYVCPSENHVQKICFPRVSVEVAEPLRDEAYWYIRTPHHKWMNGVSKDYFRLSKIRLVPKKMQAVINEQSSLRFVLTQIHDLSAHIQFFLCFSTMSWHWYFSKLKMGDCYNNRRQSKTQADNPFLADWCKGWLCA